MKNMNDMHDMNESTYGVGALMGSVGRLLRHFLFSPSVARSALPVSKAVRRPVTPLRRAVQPTRRAITPFHNSTRAYDPAIHASRSPLRIIRVVESGQAPTQTGRMFMSGRMVDVCAELDRMVEREAAMQAGV